MLEYWGYSRDTWEGETAPVSSDFISVPILTNRAFYTDHLRLTPVITLVSVLFSVITHKKITCYCLCIGNIYSWSQTQMAAS